jgi:hypothetical protein
VGLVFVVGFFFAAGSSHRVSPVTVFQK